MTTRHHLPQNAAGGREKAATPKGHGAKSAGILASEVLAKLRVPRPRAPASAWYSSSSVFSPAVGSSGICSSACRVWVGSA